MIFKNITSAKQIMHRIINSILFHLHEFKTMQNILWFQKSGEWLAIYFCKAGCKVTGRTLHVIGFLIS